MKTDVQESDDSYIMEMDLPGFSKDEVKVSLKDGYLTVKAAKGLDEESEKKIQNTFVRNVMPASVREASMWATLRKATSRASLSMVF